MSKDLDSLLPKLPYRGGFEDERSIVNAQTGGIKNVKLERFDLIPYEYFDGIRFGLKLTEGSKLMSAEGILDDWWVSRQAPESSVILWMAGERAWHDLRIICGSPSNAEASLASVYGYGALKYEVDNWKKGYQWGLNYGAAKRHAQQWSKGEILDVDSKQPHLTHFLWHVITLKYFEDHFKEGDNRP